VRRHFCLFSIRAGEALSSEDLSTGVGAALAARTPEGVEILGQPKVANATVQPDDHVAEAFIDLRANHEGASGGAMASWFHSLGDAGVERQRAMVARCR